MEVWYVESANSEDKNMMPETLVEWLDSHVTKVFCHSSETDIGDWLKSKSIYRFSEDQVPVNIQLGEGFARSFSLSNLIIKLLGEKNTDLVRSDPIVLFIHQDEVLPYFILQHIWTLNKQLHNVFVVTLHNKTLLNQIEYRFPQYWHKQMEKQCISYSHANIAWDKVILDTLNQNGYKEVIYFNPINSVIFDWEARLMEIIKEKQAHSSRFPVSSSIPLRTISSMDNNECELLTVIIPFYNLGCLLTETIESVLKSTYSTIEIIIVNDGSNDSESLKVLNDLRNFNSVVKVIDIENQGLANARNIGAQAATGKYIAFLDADDMIHPSYYTRCIQILNYYVNISFVYSWVKFFGLKDDVWVTFNTEFPYLLMSNMLSAFAVIRREDFLKYGLNKLEMDRGMEDYESWISMCENGCAGVSIPEELVFYRIRSESMSRKFNRKIVNELYSKISSFHNESYEKYGKELFNLNYANGPGYLWNNPTISYPGIGYVSEEGEITSANNLKYELIRMANSKKGRLIIKWLIKLKVNKWFK
ncbi:glycosyltransferase family 2 protein [Paenibacillus sp. 2TAB26]|uniref:glycosyltransferase family 2 protein n=1 Tax=Paenibacillus sp. 2TAB26 TaxID=3233005 RepID=UPI003F96C310